MHRTPTDVGRIRPAVPTDRDAVVAILQPTVRAGDTYALPNDWDAEAILADRFAPTHGVLIAEIDGVALDTCDIRANRHGGGAHVANGGFATHADAAGRGVARALAQRSFFRRRRRLDFR